VAGEDAAVARNPLERHLADFNNNRIEWRLSLSAQNVIRENFVSLATDEIGVRKLTRPEERRLAQQQAIEHLPGFLSALVAKAEGIPPENRSGDEKVLGAIFVTQHMRLWAINCGCWQED
jgi:hypothetical protein